MLDIMWNLMRDGHFFFLPDLLSLDWQLCILKRFIMLMYMIDNLFSKLVYEEAINCLPYTKMFSLYAQFWLDIFSLDKVGSNSVVNNNGVDTTKFASSILKVFEKAESSGCLSENLACQYISFYLQIGKIEEARSLLEKLCNEKLSEGANLWLLRVSIELKWCTSKSAIMSKTEMNFVFKLLIDVLTRLSVSKAETLWITARKVFSNDKDHFEKLVKNLIAALARGGGGDNGCSITSAIVNQVFQKERVFNMQEKCINDFLPCLILVLHFLETA